MNVGHHLEQLPETDNSRIVRHHELVRCTASAGTSSTVVAFCQRLREWSPGQTSAKRSVDLVLCGTDSIERSRCPGRSKNARMRRVS